MSFSSTGLTPCCCHSCLLCLSCSSSSSSSVTTVSRAVLWLSSRVPSLSWPFTGTAHSPFTVETAPFVSRGCKNIYCWSRKYCWNGNLITEKITGLQVLSWVMVWHRLTGGLGPRSSPLFSVVSANLSIWIEPLAAAVNELFPDDGPHYGIESEVDGQSGSRSHQRQDTDNVGRVDVQGEESSGQWVPVHVLPDDDDHVEGVGDQIGGNNHNQHTGRGTDLLLKGRDARLVT